MSLGTAIDLPNLICVINSVSIGSSKTNIQVIGRLRNIENRNTVYYYLYCGRNKSHLNLHRQRMNSISHLARTYRHIDYNEKLVDVDMGELFD